MESPLDIWQLPILASRQPEAYLQAFSFPNSLPQEQMIPYQFQGMDLVLKELQKPKEYSIQFLTLETRTANPHTSVNSVYMFEFKLSGAIISEESEK